MGHEPNRAIGVLQQLVAMPSYVNRRVGEFDWCLLRKAAGLNAPTDIALTFADYIVKRNERARRFEQLSEETIRFIEEVEKVAAAPVSLIATRFHSRAIIGRRSLVSNMRIEDFCALYPELYHWLSPTLSRAFWIEGKLLT